MILLDGKKCSQDLKEQIKKEIDFLARKPHIVDIQIGENAASDAYILGKEKAAKSNVYKIRIYIKQGKKKYYSDFSKTVTLSAKLAKPSITVSSPKIKNVKITWEKVDGAKGYEIHRSTKKDSGYKKVATTSKLQYTNGKLQRDAGYYYKVRAYKVVNGKKQYSDFSAEEYVIIK